MSTHCNMMSFCRGILVLLLLSVGLSSPVNGYCKAAPGTPDWPGDGLWQALNSSLNGRLLKPPPPGAVCHPGQPTFNVLECPIVQAEWTNTSFHVDNPVSTILNNWNNDTCLPEVIYPCSDEGYPIYVVNATSAEDVKKGVDFARKHNVRLIVKGSGHDYLGRSVAPNSLSIWTHNILGDLSFQNSFTPRGCRSSIKWPSITVGAGVEMLDAFSFAALHNMSMVGGGSPDVGFGGYLTGGGHGGLSTFYGLAADQVLEVEIVTAEGDILTANNCQNSDLFWAVRGGGGSTFGVLTSVTFKVFPDKPTSAYVVDIGALADSEDWWDAMAFLFTQLPRLSDAGMAGYTYLLPNTTACDIGVPCSLFYAAFLIQDAEPGTMPKLFAPIIEKINSSWPGTVEFIGNEQAYPNFYSWWYPNRDTTAYGNDLMLGSRLLDGESLSRPADEIKQMLKATIPPRGSANVNMVAGKGVWAENGGSNAVNPAWRKAYLHFVFGVGWEPLDEAEKDQQVELLNTQYIEALRKFIPDSGAYVNEAFPYEPNFQQAFWGSNYPRLLELKKQYDPNDVFWCLPCVGNEGWREVGNNLCTVK